jgi:hypothetical protein
MSDQHMNAGDQGTQPDSGSAPNDQITTSAGGGSPQGAPGSHGSAPIGQEGVGKRPDVGEKGAGDVKRDS